MRAHNSNNNGQTNNEQKEQEVPPESSMVARRNAISPMRPQNCESRISFPDKEQGYRKPVLKNQVLRVQKGYAEIRPIACAESQ